MYMNESTPGLTSRAFHTSMWALLTAAILGNVLVIAWRFSRKESRFRITSVLIVSLAVADLLWCSHFVLREVIVFKAVFGESGNVTFQLTTRDEGLSLCLSSSFLLFSSANAMMLIAVAIALHTVLALHDCRYGNTVVYLFLSVSWLASLVVASIATFSMKGYVNNFRRSLLFMSRDTFSIVGMFSCAGDNRWFLYTVILLCVNVTASVACSVLYCFVCCKLKRSNLTYNKSEMNNLQLRMMIIALMSVVVWWPPCLVYAYCYVTGKTVLNGKLNLEAVEAILLLVVIVSAANPVIYTIASRPFLKFVKGLCGSICYHGDEDRRELLDLQSRRDDVSRSGCTAICSCFCRLQGKLRGVGAGRPVVPLIETTESSHLFTETTDECYYLVG